MSNDHLILVLTTCHSEEIASRIAEELVNRKLAACVNILPRIESIYRWQDKLQRDEEFLLIIKTANTRYSMVQDAITELHDYELPEIIAVPIEAGEQAYLNWIKSATLVTET